VPPPLTGGYVDGQQAPRARQAAAGRLCSWPGGCDRGHCDTGEENVVRRGLASAGIGQPGTRADMERLGFYVCVEDLEDELIRAIGTAPVQALIDSQGDLGSFRSLQRQPGWRGQPARAQLRRFMGSGASRKLRYARLMAGAVDLGRLPHPLEAVLTRA
jgi:hypothetical protein